MTMFDAEPIRIGFINAEYLHAAGPGGLLVWNETHDKVVAIDAEGRPLERSVIYTGGAVHADLNRKADHGFAADEESMIIAAHADLARLSEQIENEGVFVDYETQADKLRTRAARNLETWPQVRALTPAVTRLRAALADLRIHLDTAPEAVTGPDGSLRLREEYRLRSDRDLAAITITTAVGQLEATRVEVTDLKRGRTAARLDLAIHTMALPDTAEVIASTVLRAARLRLPWD